MDRIEGSQSKELCTETHHLQPTHDCSNRHYYDGAP
ncbi:hypothetical protein COLO4_05851 [Corchorus olitorius]|uniref:Uncharacterized protein n=1 Tax=Corchorus olitorius TaxID=93759 RepID=A0A1R3KPP0_9ROSI|nr:hypothetical protein COLO4_05851 [Corchorus olitorius]